MRLFCSKINGNVKESKGQGIHFSMILAKERWKIFHILLYYHYYYYYQGFVKYWWKFMVVFKTMSLLIIGDRQYIVTVFSDRKCWRKITLVFLKHKKSKHRHHLKTLMDFLSQDLWLFRFLTNTMKNHVEKEIEICHAWLDI